METLRAFFRLTLLPLLRMLYRLRVVHADRVPSAGGVLLISNHVGYLDSFLIYAACPRPVRFIIVSRYLNLRAIRWFLDLFGAIPITPGKSRDAIRAAAACLQRGQVVCIFPEGQLTRTGCLGELKKGFELIARESGAPVQPVYMHGLWGSIFSAERGRYFRKWPHQVPWPVSIAFGPPRPAAEADVQWARGALLAASAEAFDAMPVLDETLARALIRSLKQHSSAVCFIEHGKTVRRLRRRDVLATALALARSWRQEPDRFDGETRVGLLLPSGTAPALLNAALILAGRVPVNISFPEPQNGTLDFSTAVAAIRAAGLKVVLSSRAFFPALEAADALNGLTFLDFGTELQVAGPGLLLGERFRVLFQPAGMIARGLGLPRQPSGQAVWAGGECAHPDRVILAEAQRLSSGAWIETGETLFTEGGAASLGEALWSLWLPLLHEFTTAARGWAGRSDPKQIESVCLAEKTRRLVVSPGTIEEIATLSEPWHPELRQIVRSVLVPVADAADLTGLDRRSDRVRSISGATLCPYWAPRGHDGILAISQPPVDPVPPPPNYQLQPGSHAGSPGLLLPGLALPAGFSLEDSGFVRMPAT